MRRRLSRPRRSTRRGNTLSRSSRNSAAPRKKLLSLTVMASVTASASASRPSLSSPTRPAMSLKSKRRITGARRRLVIAFLSGVSDRPERRRSRRARKEKSSGARALDRNADIGELGANAVAVERLHDIFIGAGRHGAGDLGRVGFGG